MGNKRHPELIAHLNRPLQILIKTFVKRLDSGKNCLVAIVGQTGCQPKGSKVLMANGDWKNIEDIKDADEILSPQKDGTYIPCKVMEKVSWISDDNYDIIQINKKNKKLYSCSGNHIIPVHNNFKKRITQDGKRVINDKGWRFGEYQADEFSKMASNQKSHNNIGFSSFLIDKFQGRVNCKIEPYTLGVFLGDGCSTNYNKTVENKDYGSMKRKDKQLYHNKCCRSLSITSDDEVVLEEVSKHYEIINVIKKQNTTAKSYHFSVDGILNKLIIEYGLVGKKSGEKFIPKEALLSDSEYRKKLLSGIIDTDSYYSPKSGGYQITLKSKQLIEDIRSLVYSLGARCGEIKKVKKSIKKTGFEGDYYSLSFYIGDLNLPIRVKRRMRDVPTTYLNSNRIAIDSIKNNKKEMVYGFCLDSPSQWYVTDNWMVTHNSGKSFASVCILYWTYVYMHGEPPELEDTVNHWFFRAKDFMEAMNDPTLKKRELNLWDEMGVSASHKAHASMQNRAIGWLVQTFRNLEQLVIFTVPTLAYVDKTVRNLLHYQLEVRKVLNTDKICIIKPLEIQYNIRMDKTYYHNLFWKSNDGSGFMDEVDVVGVPLAPPEFIKAYEEKSWAFKAELNKQIQGMIEQANEKDRKNSLVGIDKIMEDLTPLQKRVWDFCQEGLGTKEIAKILEVTPSSVCGVYHALRHKGLEVEGAIKRKKSPLQNE